MTDALAGSGAPQSDPSSWMQRWLGLARHGQYLHVAQGDVGHLIALYQWQAQVSAQLAHDLGHLEVCMRNAYDSALSAYLPTNAHWVYCGDAIFAPFTKSRPSGSAVVRLNSTRLLLARAAAQAQKPDDVIARLPFGFWRALTSSSHEIAIWRPALHRAYPPGTRRADVSERVSRLHRLRNRCAHHKSLLHLNLNALHDDVLELATLLEPHVAAHIRLHSRVSALLDERPSLANLPQPPR